MHGRIHRQPDALRSLQELQVPGQMGRPVRRRDQQSRRSKRTTEVVKHREGGDPVTSRKSPGRTEYRRDHARARCDSRRRLRRLGQQGLELRRRPRRRSVAEGLSARTSCIELYNEAGQLAIAYNVYRCWVSEYQALPDLDANANAVAIQHIKLENEGWMRDVSVTEPTEPSFTPPT